MQKSKVAIIRCNDYNQDNVYQALKRGIDLIGGLDKFVKKGEKILLKVNNLAGSSPDESVTTHPSILEAMIRILDKKGVTMTYGDSPGFEKPINALKKSGYLEVGEKYKIKPADFDTGKSVDFKDGKVCKKFNIANACLESDGMISLSKMKTHMLTRITGAVKNQFGCVYGLSKASYHLKIPNPTKFSEMLIDLNLLLKPRLYIMDGISAMEGNGPRGGTPVKMNCLIISTDPIAVDATFARMIDLNPMFVPTIKLGKSRGLGTYLKEEIELVGDPISNFIKKDFNVIRKPIKNRSIFSITPNFIRNMVRNRPQIDPDKCIKCGICVNACPVKEKALDFKNNDKTKPPVYDYNKCIRCFCCQEMCPKKAIYVTRPPLGRLLKGKNKLKKF